MSRARTYLPWTAFILGVALAACSGDGEALEDAGTPDAGVVADPDAGLVDTGPALEPSTLFGPCVEDAQCPGEGAICRTASETGAPGGFCTVPCEDRTPCDFNNVYHHCLARDGETQKYCERRCLNGIDCGRAGYTCQLFQGEDEGACFGLCDADEQCGGGQRCEPYSARCVASDAPDDGAINGETCAAATDCRSEFCITEADNGWPGGACISRCILPVGYNSSSFYGGDTLPRAACPEGNLCLPLLGSFTRGDPGACLVDCDKTEDCRPGYTCRKQFDANGMQFTFTNGVCWPGG